MAGYREMCRKLIAATFKNAFIRHFSFLQQFLTISDNIIELTYSMVRAFDGDSIFDDLCE